MAAPHVEEESTSITIAVEKWPYDKMEQYFPVHRIGGYPWRLHMIRMGHCTRKLYMICDKSSESELWHCTATVTPSDENIRTVSHTFNSWDKDSQTLELGSIWFAKEYILKLNVAIKDEGNSWRVRPILDPFDGSNTILVIGEDKKKIPVHKGFLASQSSFFDRLFNGDFKEKNMSEIFIGGVEYEEFSNIIEMVYGSDGPSLTEDNVYKFLELADRFDLKIVEDRVVNSLLSSFSSFSIHEKLLLSEQFNIHFLKDELLKRYTKAQITDLISSTEFDQLSHDSLKLLFIKGSISVGHNLRIFSYDHISPSPTVTTESMISMVIDGYEREQFSSVHRINGFPWQLRVEKVIHQSGYFSYVDDYNVYVICDKSNEAELWKCTATISSNLGSCERMFFTSWDNKSHEKILYSGVLHFGWLLKVTIATDDGESYFRLPTLDPLMPRDGILVFENTEKKIKVNKKSLASQSLFFDRLFFGNFKEKDMNEIQIGDVNYEEFSIIMALLYGCDDSLNCNNAERMLHLAERFELRIVENRVVSFLLSSSSSALSIPKKLLISDQVNLSLLKDCLLSQFNSIKQLKELSESPEWNQMSKETLRIMFKKFCV